MPHLEFTVEGPPISHQTKDRGNLTDWRSKVRSEAAKRWGSSPALTQKLECTILNFHEGEDVPLDDDNMVKPIRDALNGLVYADDSQIRHSETIQVGIDATIRIRRASAVLLAAYSRGREFVYVRIDEVPDFIQLPQ